MVETTLPTIKTKHTGKGEENENFRSKHDWTEEKKISKPILNCYSQGTTLYTLPAQVLALKQKRASYLQKTQTKRSL